VQKHSLIEVQDFASSQLTSTMEHNNQNLDSSTTQLQTQNQTDTSPPRVSSSSSPQDLGCRDSNSLPVLLFFVVEFGQFLFFLFGKIIETDYLLGL
jgi:hypothetical protein